MNRSDLIHQVAQHLEPWAWETKSFNATVARDDAMSKAEQIVDLFGPIVPTLGGASTAEARILAVTTEMRRYLPNACGDWADEIENALAMRTVTPATLDNTAATTSPEELARIQLLADVELHLQSCRIFLTKREKMHPDGVSIHDELQARVTAAINEGGVRGR